MGSVKDLQIIVPPGTETPGKGRFSFSDRYSVFDWGEMPDKISAKGKALCLIGAYFFEELQKRGIPTHYIGLPENGEVKSLNQIKKPSHIMEVSLFRVIYPEYKNGIYDYSAYTSVRGNFLVPLEVIYRNALPPGSSVFKRLERGEIGYRQLGLSGMPLPGQKLNKPLLDVSTKLENTDRYIDWEEAKKISGLDERQISRLKEITLEVNRLISEKTESLGLYNEDGKFEFGVDSSGEITLVDVLGTPDECRFTADDSKIPLSKEIARIYYRSTAWYKEVESAKQKYGIHWKEQVSPPPPLPEELRLIIEQVYQSLCNEITGKKWFAVSAFSDLLNRIRDYLQSLPG